jgi:hypothetical protein
VDKVVEAVVKTVEEEGAEVAWRMAGEQFVKLTKEPLLALITRHVGETDAGFRTKLATFLETELGTAIITALLSVSLSALPPIPVPGGHVAVARLARELRLKAMAGAGNTAADLLMAPLRETIVTYLQALPADPPRLSATNTGTIHVQPVEEALKV